MAALPKGSSFAIATAFGAAMAVTIATNAGPPVLTSIGHGFIDGDVVEFTSGWSKLNRRFFKVDQLSADTFALVDIDTGNAALYPAGAGIGSCRKVAAWTQIPKTMNPQTTGGDPKNVDYSFTEDENDYTINNGFAATGYTLEIDDDITTAGYLALVKATDEQTDTVLRILQKGAKNPTYLPCNCAINPMPVFNDNSINRMKVAFNGRARPTRYTGAVLF